MLKKSDNIIISREQYGKKHIKKFGNFYIQPMSAPYDANTQLMKNKE